MFKNDHKIAFQREIEAIDHQIDALVCEAMRVDR
jgi:hypothetical protein